MKFKILLIAALSVTLSVSLFAKTDSIGVKNNDGKKLILFKVKAKDTYYSIGRRYNVKAEVLMKFNGSQKPILSIGSIINIPTDQPYKKSGKETPEKTAKETKKEKAARLEKEAAEAKAAKKRKHKDSDEYVSAPGQEQPQQPERVVQQPVQGVQQPVQAVQQVQQDTTPPTQYKVSAGETLYAISKRFNTTVDEITKLNNLTSTTLIPGQILLVKPGVSTTPPPIPAVVHAEPQVVAKRDSTIVAPVRDSSNAERRFNANKFGLFEKNEKGAATWIDDPTLDPNKKLVLHRTAPVGTVIKITNPMTNRTTFAKVVGRFTDNESTKDVIIVMTKNVADSLGALDKRFYVNISYGSPNE